MKPKYKVKRATGEQLADVGVGFEKFPKAGPHPNVTGMKKLFWGMDSFVIRVGKYAYKVDYHTWLKF